MSAQHTPGPWRITHTGFLGVGILPSSGEMRTEGGPIITAWSTCIGSKETEANARLIAAAPELLAALEWLYDGTGSPVDVSAVIAKATGAA